MKRITKTKKAIILLIGLSLLIQGCRIKTAPSGITRSGFFFDTLINITIYGTDDTALLDECFSMCRYYEQLLSITEDGSDISKVNAAGTGPVAVSDETADLITYAMQYYESSDHQLDITIAPLSERWTKARTEGVPPSEAEIRAILPHIGADKIETDIDGNTVSKSDPDIMLDTGALAKGYIADRLRELLIGKGVSSAVISLGGNIITIGSKPDGSDFRIGIRRPFGQADETAAALNISDMSVVTSGIYERCFTYNGRLYHHILDPDTGYPADTDLTSATIISRSSLEGDALSTICLLYGFEKAEELINNTPDVEAVFITKDECLHYTRGAEKYLL